MLRVTVGGNRKGSLGPSCPALTGSLRRENRLKGAWDGPNGEVSRPQRGSDPRRSQDSKERKVPANITLVPKERERGRLT